MVLPSVASSRPLLWDLRLTLFLTALCTLLLEVLLTRVLSVVMWYHFTFAVISISLLGIAAGAMRCYRRFPTVKTEEEAAAAFRAAVPAGLILFSLAVVFPLALMTFWVETPTYSLRGLVLLLAYFVGCAGPFYVSGYLTAIVVRCGARRVSALYAVDLLAGALGCLLAIPLLDYLGGIGSLLLVSVLLAATAAVLARRANDSRCLVQGSVAAVLLLGLLVVQTATSRVDLRTVKLSLREEHRSILEVKWNSHSRLAVLDYFNPNKPDAYLFLSWGLSDRYKGWRPRQYLITIDGASETPLAQLQEDIRQHEYLEWDVTSLPYHLRPGTKALVIGAGGGRDLLTALYFGSQDVTGVELNRGIVDWVKGKYADFAGHLYTRPGVHVVVDDGRNFVRGSPDRFAVLQISMIDTFAATAAGAYTLSENNLYTAEAFDEYLDHLTDDGILSINRFFLEPPQQTLRVVTLAREALERRGLDAARHVVVVRKNTPFGNNGLVMVKKTPFTAEEVAQVSCLCQKCGFEPIALPGQELHNPFTDYLQAASPETYYRNYPFDVRPPTDDRPFFFNTFKIDSLLQSLQLRESVEEVRRYNLDAVFILFVLLALAGVALLLFLFVPLLQARRSGAVSLPARRLLYFIWIGLGFILVEVVLIQRFHLYLGHPVYSLAVILVSLLAFSGLGSALTSRLTDEWLRRGLALACGGALAVVLAQELFWPWFLQRTLGLGLEARIGLAVAFLLPVGLLLGMPYPLGLRAVSAKYPDGLPWVWAVNGAASVLGSIAAFALAMALGFHIVLLVGGLCYLGALLSGVLFLRPERDVSSA
jgi:spermidine synthase